MTLLDVRARLKERLKQHLQLLHLLLGFFVDYRRRRIFAVTLLLILLVLVDHQRLDYLANRRCELLLLRLDEGQVGSVLGNFQLVLHELVLFVWQLQHGLQLLAEHSHARIVDAEAGVNKSALAHIFLLDFCVLVFNDIDVEDLLAIEAAAQVADVIIDGLWLVVVVIVVEELGHDVELLLVDGHDVLISL